MVSHFLVYFIPSSQALNPNSLGPVIGAYVADVYGWRWDFYILAICVSASVFLVLNHPTSDSTVADWNLPIIGSAPAKGVLPTVVT